MPSFKYDLISLFELIEARPCLWNKYSKDYKNKKLKVQRWTEVFHYLDDTYADQSPEEQKITGEIIINKWANIRDAFTRSLKTQQVPGQSTRKKYCYADHLHFLQMCSNENNSIDSNSHELNYFNENVTEEGEQSSQTSVHSNIIPIHYIKKEPKRKRILDHLEKHILEEIKKPKRSLESKSKEEAFFVSFQPYIQDMSENERLELHLQIVKAIKDIKNRRN